MTEDAPIVPVRTKLWCADETLRMVIESVSDKRGIPATDVFWELVQSPVYDALYDPETGMWAEYPAMLLYDFTRHPK